MALSLFPTSDAVPDAAPHHAAARSADVAGRGARSCCTAIASIAAVYAAGKIFRTGLLMQGKAATFGEMWRWVRAVGAKRSDAEQLEHDVRREERGDLAGAVEDRGDFDDVAADEIQAGEPADELLRLVTREAADFRRAGARRERRIDRIDVERDVERTAAARSRARAPSSSAAPSRFDHADVDRRDALVALDTVKSSSSPYIGPRMPTWT